MDNLNIKNLSPEQKAALLADLQAEQNSAAKEKRDAYEAIRKDVVGRIMAGVEKQAAEVKLLFDFVKDETSAFYDVMCEYGQLRHEGQMNYTITDGDRRIEVKTNKIKKFDERAGVAAKRLVEFLKEWVKNSLKGTDDPMYQLAMSLLSRNRYGELDYKSISKLYELESKFSAPEYSEIMQLFKESNRVDSTITNFYFSKKDELGVWRKIEISFNRL
ncbi:DUF3164 family protein [Parabacteroides sp. PF5-9]|uniref:DUF3164 family protein n=1 Tax=Parabacteroides sp. PF5-9 TaxID=1742404 RepID=UPI002475AB4B|nr:DUF3164 family protein [Parabacteroides sp. PF5-9]MDH6357226.1 hypothetical protein [Parabacteroides sp. PF5-9]